jgi:hypothetical protein
MTIRRMWQPLARSVRGRRRAPEALLRDDQEFVQASRSSALIQMIARLDEVFITSLNGWSVQREQSGEERPLKVRAMRAGIRDLSLPSH